MIYEYFTKEALQAQDDKCVPAVMYDADGKRHVIGMAKLKMDDTGLSSSIAINEQEMSIRINKGTV